MPLILAQHYLLERAWGNRLRFLQSGARVQSAPQRAASVHRGAGAKRPAKSNHPSTDPALASTVTWIEKVSAGAAFRSNGCL